MKFRLLFPVVLLSVTCLLAQQSADAPKAPPEAKPGTPTFKARSQLVLVPVIVNDKGGKHVGGLAKDVPANRER